MGAHISRTEQDDEHPIDNNNWCNNNNNINVDALYTSDIDPKHPGFNHHQNSTPNLLNNFNTNFNEGPVQSTTHSINTSSSHHIKSSVLLSPSSSGIAIVGGSSKVQHTTPTAISSAIPAAFVADFDLDDSNGSPYSRRNILLSKSNLNTFHSNENKDAALNSIPAPKFNTLEVGNHLKGTKFNTNICYRSSQSVFNFQPDTSPATQIVVSSREKDHFDDRQQNQRRRTNSSTSRCLKKPSTNSPPSPISSQTEASPSTVCNAIRIKVFDTNTALSSCNTLVRSNKKEPYKSRSRSASRQSIWQRLVPSSKKPDTTSPAEAQKIFTVETTAKHSFLSPPFIQRTTSENCSSSKNPKSSGTLTKLTLQELNKPLRKRSLTESISLKNFTNRRRRRRQTLKELEKSPSDKTHTIFSSSTRLSFTASPKTSTKKLSVDTFVRPPSSRVSELQTFVNKTSRPSKVEMAASSEFNDAELPVNNKTDRLLAEQADNKTTTKNVVSHTKSVAPLVYKTAGGNTHNSSSASVVAVCKDVEQLSLATHGGQSYGSLNVHPGVGGAGVGGGVGGATRRNSRPRESPIHQARSNIIAENLQALMQTDATTGALLQEHLSESHRGTIVTAIMSPMDDGGGRYCGGYNDYYAAQQQQEEQKAGENITKIGGSSLTNTCATSKSTATLNVKHQQQNQHQSHQDSPQKYDIALKPFMSTGGGGLSMRRKSSKAEEIRAYMAATNDAAVELDVKPDDKQKTGKTLSQFLTNKDPTGSLKPTTSLDDSDSVGKLADVKDKIIATAATPSQLPDTAKAVLTYSTSKFTAAPTTQAPLMKMTATAAEPFGAELLNNKVWKRLTEKSMLQKNSSSDMLKCIGAFLHRRFTHLSHLFQPNEPVLWMRGVDRSLIAQGWQDMAFLSPANIVFVYMLLRTLDAHVAGNLRQLQAHVLTALYVSYSYMGHEISYPVRLFLAADIEHKDRFWLRCMRLVDIAGDSMLKINNDPLLFSALFHELIAHMRYLQPPVPLEPTGVESSSTNALIPTNADTAASGIAAKAKAVNGQSSQENRQPGEHGIKLLAAQPPVAEEELVEHMITVGSEIVKESDSKNGSKPSSRPSSVGGGGGLNGNEIALESRG